MDFYGTIGPACADVKLLQQMVEAGMTGIRMNLSHGPLAAHKDWLALLRKAGVKKLLIDLQGPELRIGRLPQPLSLAAGRTALRIISIGFVISAVSTTVSGALEGLGKGTESLVISLCRYVVFIMPLAALLCNWLGADGAWHAFWLTEVLAAVVSGAVYRRAVTHKK